MTATLAVIGVVVWLAGAVWIAAQIPEALRNRPTAQGLLARHPVAMRARIALLIAVWPAIAIRDALNAITERRTR